MLTAEESFKMVPSKMREARHRNGGDPIADGLVRHAADGPSRHSHGGHAGHGARRSETAPLLFTALFSNYWLNSGGELDLMQPTASLAVLIYNFSGSCFENQVEMAWKAALVLVLLVLTTNLIGQAFSRRSVQN